MRYIKLLGLAVISTLALVAFMGTGTASATVLCETTPEVAGQTICPVGWDYGAGTEIRASLVANTTTKFVATDSTLLSTCEGASIAGVTMNTGSAKETVKVEVTKEDLLWAGCKPTTETLEGGTIIIHHVSFSDEVGTLVAVGFKVKVNFAGLNCVYGAGAGPGVDIGDIKGGAAPTIEINAVLAKAAGSFLCPGDAQWLGKYTLETPSPIWFGEKTEE